MFKIDRQNLLAMQFNLRFLIYISLFHCCLAETVKYNYDDESWEIFNYVVINERDIEKLERYSEYSSINFKWSTISTMDSRMLSKLASLRDLRFERGNLKILEISPTLENIQLDNCQTRNITINPNQEYKLKSLIIWNTPMTTLPTHLNSLKQLFLLDLSDNQIEFINLSEISGMNKLTSLYLNSNKIIKLSSSPEAIIHLPSLKLLHLFENRLTSVSFENWNATSLRHLHLHKNQLSMAASLFSAFPVLQDFWMHENPLYCAWKDFMVEEFRARNVQLYKVEDLKCTNAGEVETALEVFDYKISKKFGFQISVVKQSIENVNNQILQHIQQIYYFIEESVQTLNQSIVQNERKLQTLQESIIQLNHKNDDLTESFYLFNLEHHNDHSSNTDTPIQQDNNAQEIDAKLIQQQQQLDQFEKSLKKIDANQKVLNENLRKISLLSVLMSNGTQEN